MYFLHFAMYIFLLIAIEMESPSQMKVDEELFVSIKTTNLENDLDNNKALQEVCKDISDLFNSFFSCFIFYRHFILYMLIT